MLSKNLISETEKLAAEKSMKKDISHLKANRQKREDDRSWETVNKSKKIS